MQKRLIALGLMVSHVSGAAAATPMPLQEYAGRGVQIFRCKVDGVATSWQLLGPDANLYDAQGKIVARHFFGPSWQANDGSEITGKVLVANASPDGLGNAPWLVLRVVSAQGAGIIGQVQLVARIDTRGGGTPDQACTTANRDTTMKVPYSARYIFFSQKR